MRLHLFSSAYLLNSTEVEALSLFYVGDGCFIGIDFSISGRGGLALASFYLFVYFNFFRLHFNQVAAV